MALTEVLRPKEKRKLLALDGGGIRGLITIEVLAAIEDQLRGERGSDFRLAEEFDYVAGTSTGAVIATCVSLGMSVDQIRTFYLDSGREMFDKASLLRRFRNKYEDDRLATKLREVIGGGTTFGSESLRTLLLIVMRNATTDSPWPLSNNPQAKYNLATRRDEGRANNLDLPLWQLVRASTAAPTYFPPEVIDAGGPGPFLMVDGGVTTYNNPAFLLFLMATVEPYNLQWPSGAERLLLVSVGTGTSPKANQDLAPEDMNLLYNASSIPSALMFAALNEQDLLCRVFGECRHGDMLDREVGTMVGARGPAEPKLFTYVRYNAELTRDWLDAQGLGHINPQDVQALDSTSHMAELAEVGRAVGRQVQPEHFAGF
ncbi:patatin-like phospholipase family protein [Pedococcus sp. 5OH_020]|uniref:patatin-like phospholipase family protein n=1 Tax=Pedococcus sp. 5OH_020 TaxID=2989814 RepID=UPI0022E9C2E9|nr:patatin-like phospholipase family protein [Pedococcus sp. 5OH_020]